MYVIEQVQAGSETTYEEAHVIQGAAEVIRAFTSDPVEQRKFLEACELRAREVDVAMQWIAEYDRMERGESDGCEAYWVMLGVKPPTDRIVEVVV